MIRSGKSYSYWLARFNRKMSFHFPWVVPLISDRSVWHNGKQPWSGLPTSLRSLQHCPNTHAYSCDPTRRQLFTRAHLEETFIHAEHYSTCCVLNAGGTRAGKRSKRDRTLEELAYANCHECNFAKLIALLCAGHQGRVRPKHHKFPYSTMKNSFARFAHVFSFVYILQPFSNDLFCDYLDSV